MQAYAVMDGGGMKGAALAGCLQAAEKFGIEFIGFGGTSAGSIVALLACIGYAGDELLGELMTTELKPGKLLSSVKEPLAVLKQLPGDLGALAWWNLQFRLAKYQAPAKLLKEDFGLTGCGGRFQAGASEVGSEKAGQRSPGKLYFC